MGFAVPEEAYVRAEDTARQTYAMVDELAQVRAVRSGLPRLGLLTVFSRRRCACSANARRDCRQSVRR